MATMKFFFVFAAALFLAVTKAEEVKEVERMADEGDGCKVEFFQHVGYGGHHSTYTENKNVARNDDMSSLKVSPGCCAIIYEHYHFQGKHRKICEDTANIGSWWNDKVSSVKIVLNDCRVEFYQHGGYHGVRNVYTKDTKHVARNDEMSSLKVGGACCAVIYEHYNYGGRSQKFCKSTGWVGKWWNDRVSSVKLVGGPHRHECTVEFFQHGGYKGVRDVYRENTGQVKRNDDMSSMKVEDGCCAEIYEHYNFGGKHEKHCRSVSWIGNNWNDIVSSVKVFPASYKDEAEEISIEEFEKDAPAEEAEEFKKDEEVTEIKEAKKDEEVANVEVLYEEILL